MSTKNETFTDEQNAALVAFEAAAESHDLRAFGQGRKCVAQNPFLLAKNNSKNKQLLLTAVRLFVFF